MSKEKQKDLQKAGRTIVQDNFEKIERKSGSVEAK